MIAVKNKVTLAVVVITGIVAPAAMGYFLLANPWKPRASEPVTPVTPVTPIGGSTVTPTAGIPGEVRVEMAPVVSGSQAQGTFIVRTLVYDISTETATVSVNGKVTGLRPNQQYELSFCINAGGDTCSSAGDRAVFTARPDGIVEISGKIFVIRNTPEQRVVRISLSDFYVGTGIRDSANCDARFNCMNGVYTVSRTPFPTITTAPVTPPVTSPTGSTRNSVTLKPVAGVPVPGNATFSVVRQGSSGDTHQLRVTGNVWGFRPNSPYIVEFCSRAPGCTGMGEMISLTTDKSGTAFIDRVVKVPSSAALPVDGIRMSAGSIAPDTEHCTQTRECLYSAYAIPAGVGATTTPPPVTPTRAPANVILSPVPNAPVKGAGSLSFQLLSRSTDRASVRVSGSISNMKPLTRYIFQFCGRGTECFGLSDMLPIDTDVRGNAAIERDITVLLTGYTPIDGVRVSVQGDINQDTQRCDARMTCLYAPYLPSWAVYSDLTPKPTRTITFAPTPTNPPTPTTVLTRFPTVTPPLASPDLVIRNVTRDQFYYRVQYCNQGSGSSRTPFAVRIANADTGRNFTTGAFFTVPVPGQCATTGGITCGLVGVPCTSRVALTATVDATKTVSESNEVNNTFRTSIGRISPTPLPVRSPTPLVSSITVYASGTSVNNVFPFMSVDVDGVNYYGNWVSGGNPSSTRRFNAYTFTFRSVGKPKTVRVRFTNDVYAPPDDRNLWVDRVIVNGVTYDLGNEAFYTVGGFGPDVSNPSITGCAAGSKRTEVLACTGYVDIPLR